jgi:hypothetical protein
MAKHKCSVIAGVNKGSEVIETRFLGSCLTIMVKNGLFSSYAIDIKLNILDSHEIIYQDMLLEKSSEILAEDENLYEEIAESTGFVEGNKMHIVALKFKDGTISVIEIDEKKLLFMIDSLRPHPLTQYI